MKMRIKQDQHQNIYKLVTFNKTQTANNISEGKTIEDSSICRVIFLNDYYNDVNNNNGIQ